MPIEIVLPRVDMGMETGVIGAWKVANGDKVAQGQLLFEINTDKAVMEVDSPAEGIVHGITAKVGDTLPVGTVVAVLYREGEASPGIADTDITQVAPLATSPAAPTARVAPAAKLDAMPDDSKIRATPIARRLARLAGIDLGPIFGSGPCGRITRADVEGAIDAAGRSAAVPAAPAAAPAAPAAGQTSRLIPFDSIRRITAKRLTQSVQTAPHFYLTANVEMTACNELRRRAAPRIERRIGVRLSLTMLLLRMVAPLLVEHPLLNASAEGEAVRYHDRVDIGVAMERDGRLVVPVLRDVASKSLEEIARDFAVLTASVRDRTIAPSDLGGSTFTISNLGMFGVDAFTAIINPPEAAILAVGRSVDTPVGRNGKIELRPQAAFCLSSDHRIVDGVVAARFMASLREAVEHPETLL